jgi:hypothetical protein
MTNRFLKVKEFSNLVRDSSSGGILNVSEQDYKKYKEEKEIIKRKQQLEQDKENRLNTLEHKVNSIEDKLDKILGLITNGKS